MRHARSCSTVRRPPAEHQEDPIDIERRPADDDDAVSTSAAWPQRLASDGATRARARGELGDFLLRAVEFEFARRRATVPGLSDADARTLSDEARDAALATLLRRLAEYRGQSRFATWAAKFAIAEAAKRLRERRDGGRDRALCR